MYILCGSNKWTFWFWFWPRERGHFQDGVQYGCQYFTTCYISITIQSRKAVFSDFGLNKAMKSLKLSAVGIDKSKMAACEMSTWCLILLYIIYYSTWECSGLSFRPQQIQPPEWNYHRLICIDKSKMAASKMAGWSLERLYLSYDSTQKGVV